jgi:hypothetical protein
MELTRLWGEPVRSMTTPAPVEPPTPENVHLYRAAVLAWRKAAIEERSQHADRDAVRLLSSPPALAVDPLEMKQVVDVLSTPSGGKFLSSKGHAQSRLKNTCRQISFLA